MSWNAGLRRSKRVLYRRVVKAKAELERRNFLKNNWIIVLVTFVTKKEEELFNARRAVKNGGVAEHHLEGVQVFSCVHHLHLDFPFIISSRYDEIQIYNYVHKIAASLRKLRYLASLF